jgi:hypothetical protein
MKGASKRVTMTRTMTRKRMMMKSKSWDSGDEVLKC